MDGVLGGCSAILMLSAASSFALSQAHFGRGLDPLPIYGLVGSILGFLCLNLSPAKVFMGDVGSTFIGSAYRGYALQQRDDSSAISLLLVSFPKLADAGGCVLRRIQYRQPILRPHKLMLYQRLHQSDWKHSQVASLYSGLQPGSLSLTSWEDCTGFCRWLLFHHSSVFGWTNMLRPPFLISLRNSQQKVPA